MARYMVVGESVAAPAAGLAVAALTPGASVGYKLRRLTVGVRTTTAVVPTSQQATIGIARQTTRGVTPASTVTPVKMDPNTAAAGATGLDLATFGTPPVVGATQYEATFNTQSGVDLPFEFLEELISASGTANGFAFVNVGIALPANHFYTLSVEFEE